MSQEYTEDKEVTMARLGSGRRLYETLLIVVAVFAIYLMVSLLSFNPSDPSWSQTAWHEPIHNLGGIPGAWLADTLFFIFGVMAYAIPAIVLGGCWFSWLRRNHDEFIDYFAVALRLIGAMALIATSCGLAAINADDIWYFASGGVVGSLLSTAMMPLLNGIGGTIVLLCLWAAGLTLFTGWSWLNIAEKLGSVILGVLTFATNRTRRDNTWHDEDYEDEDVQRIPHEPRRERLLKMVRIRRQRVAEKFVNPVGRKTDAALFSGKRMDDENDPLFNEPAVSMIPDDVLFSDNRATHCVPEHGAPLVDVPLAPQQSVADMPFAPEAPASVPGVNPSVVWASAPTTATPEPTLAPAPEQYQGAFHATDTGQNSASVTLSQPTVAATESRFAQPQAAAEHASFRPVTPVPPSHSSAGESLVLTQSEAIQGTEAIYQHPRPAAVAERPPEPLRNEPTEKPARPPLYYFEEVEEKRAREREQLAAWYQPVPNDIQHTQPAYSSPSSSSPLCASSAKSVRSVEVTEDEISISGSVSDNDNGTNTAPIFTVASSRSQVKEGIGPQLPRPNRVRVPTRRELASFGIRIPSQKVAPGSVADSEVASSVQQSPVLSDEDIAMLDDSELGLQFAASQQQRYGSDNLSDGKEDSQEVPFNAESSTFDSEQTMLAHQFSESQKVRYGEAFIPARNADVPLQQPIQPMSQNVQPQYKPAASTQQAYQGVPPYSEPARPSEQQYQRAPSQQPQYQPAASTQQAYQGVPPHPEPARPSEQQYHRAPSQPPQYQPAASMQQAYQGAPPHSEPARPSEQQYQRAPSQPPQYQPAASTQQAYQGAPPHSEPARPSEQQYQRAPSQQPQYQPAASTQQAYQDVAPHSESARPFEQVQQPVQIPPQYPQQGQKESLIHPFLMRNGDDRPAIRPTTPLPSLDLLASPPAAVEPVDTFALEQMARLVETRLADFRIKADVVNYSPGPVITRFELNLAPGVKAARISNLSRDLARSLSTVAVRVVEVIPGKPYVGLELPNKKRQTVYLREVLDCQKFRDNPSPLTIVLGKDIAGDPVVADLQKMPHLLVAGTTGSGKSVGVNAMILSMLYKATPEDVRFIMIDPKMLELSVYEGIPHLLTEVVTDMKDAANALRWSVNEMERRYKLMSALGVRNLAGYNERVMEANRMGRPIPDPFWKPGDSMDIAHPVLEKLPYIVVLVDEFADLMMTVGKKVEELIARLAQKARAAGIHLVLATQRPSVDVITGLIKANIPTRIAFTVSSKIDSRTILDQGGAESLLGMGDMLYSGPNSTTPVRVHGAFVRDQEVHAVVQDWKARGRPRYVEGITSEGDSEGGSGGFDGEEELDALFDQAVSFVVGKRKASISGVQRQFRIGYNRAARIVEQMEAQGIVSPQGHNGNREVLAPPPFE